jgi:primary-amine oxidase
VLDRIGYEQHGVVRPIIYRLALSEIYVPYGLDDPNWVWRTAFDVGEYNLGQFAVELEKNVDVPENAVFFDSVLAGDTGSNGGSYALPQAIAMYERDGG